ncbi:MAG: EAL domain-containing protein [Alphaproteobacteria bacterium]
MLAAIDGKAGDLVRYARVDNWTTQQTQIHSYQFLVALGEHVAGIDDVSMEHVRRQLGRLASTANLLNLDERSPLVQALPGKLDLRADFTAAVIEIRSLLEGRDSLRGDSETFRKIKAILGPWLTDLQSLMVNLTHIRLGLQDRDLANASRLIHVNRFLLLGIVAVGAMFTTMLIVETRAARRAEADARFDRRRFQDFAGIASDWLWETDETLRLTFVSDEIHSFRGEPASHYIGKPITYLVARFDDEDAGSRLTAATAGREPFRDLILSIGDGSQFLKISGSPVRHASGQFRGFRGICTDISTEVRREGRIRFLAEHDTLTGLSNRSRLQTQLRAILEGERSADQRGTLLLFDLDGFKEVNDTFGHDVGDALLVCIAERLRADLRQADTIARLGGDEFAVIHVGDGRDDPEIMVLARRLLASIRRPLQVHGFEFVVGTSIGIACFPKDGTSVEDLLKAADLALYAAKSVGGNEAVIYHPDMSERLKRKRRLEEDLKQSLETDGLSLHLQPQVDLATGRLIGGEALLRWHHPELGPISPEVFINVAEETGLILPLGRWVLEEACRAARRWSTQMGDGMIAVNVSPAQFIHQNLVDEVTDVLDKTGLDPCHLELEITEGLLMRDQELAIRTLATLDGMGVRLAIDDFGTGYSSLSYLKRFRVHKVKIDKAFVRDLGHDQGDDSIVRAVVMMSQAFGFRTIAEGVETEAQRRRLITLGCDEGQGYLFGRPEPIDSFLTNVAGGDAPGGDRGRWAVLERSRSSA